MIQPFPFDNFVDIQSAPMHLRDSELVLPPTGRGPVGFIADQPGAVGEFQNDMELTKTRLLCTPANLRRTGKIHQRSLVAKRQRPVPLTLARPDVIRIISGFVVMALPDSRFA